MIPFAGALYTS